MKESISPTILANRVRLHRTQHCGAFLMLEGDADSRFLRRFIDNGTCKIIVCFGRENVFQTIAILESEVFPGVVAVVDADFAVLEERPPPSSNILMTDCHDLEGMLLSSPALERALVELGSPDKIERFEATQGSIRAALLCAAIPIGYLRWASSINGLHLRFENLSFSAFIDDETLAIDVTAMITAVKGHSQRHDLDTATLVGAVQEMAGTPRNEWHVCSGHDLLNVLALGLRRAIGSHGGSSVWRDRLDAALRLAYDDEYFRGTELYLKIRSWERINTPYSVLARCIADAHD